MENVNVYLEDENTKLTVLEGKAPEQEPLFREKSYNVVGGPGTVLEIVSKDPLTSIIGARDDEDNDIFLFVDRDKFSISLNFNTVMSNTVDTYTSLLKLSKKLEEFGINTGKSWTTFELAKFIKMNRMFFEKKSTAMELVSLLQNFKAKVDKDIENADDTRGNRKILLQQKVDSNIPENFKIKIPIFKGIEDQTIEVEVMIDATDYSCQLISPEVKDFIDTESSKLIDDELKEIKELHPNLKVIELV